MSRPVKQSQVAVDDVYGNLTVKRVYRKQRANVTKGRWTDEYAETLCKCGKVSHIRTSNLRLGKTKSCGCTRTSSWGHNLSYHPGYHTWTLMLQRCNGVTPKWAKDYKNRGIIVCDEWNPKVNKNAVYNFTRWYSEVGGKKGLTLERVDNDGNYCPENCKMIPMSEQSNNTRRTKFYRMGDETKTLAQWSRDERCKVSYYCLKQRLNKNMSLPEALTEKPKGLYARTNNSSVRG